MEWVLILFVHAGIFSDSDSMALTSVPGFKTEQECAAAGKRADALTDSTKKKTRFVCVYRSKN